MLDLTSLSVFIINYLSMHPNVNVYKTPNNRQQIFEGGLKSSYNDIRSAVDDIFDHWDPSTATLMEKVCGAQGSYVET